MRITIELNALDNKGMPDTVALYMANTERIEFRFQGQPLFQVFLGELIKAANVIGNHDAAAIEEAPF